MNSILFKYTFLMSMGQEIIDLLKEKSQQEYEYINPHFLQAITSSIYDYYNIEDDEVDEWVIGMFGA